MVQGDSYQLAIELDADYTQDDVALIEVSIGSLRKRYPDEVGWKEGMLYVPLTQAETFGFAAMEPVQVRLKLINGEVHASGVERMPVLSSLSKVVL